MPNLKRWPKAAGRKPTPDLLKAVRDAQAARTGSKDAIAVAMAMRDTGATQRQIAAALGGPHRNKIAQLLTKGKARRIFMPSQDGHEVYRITLKR